jgi:hypothetical protein
VAGRAIVSSLLAIDSGFPNCAVAIARNRCLYEVASVPHGERAFTLGVAAFDRVVVEIPQSDGRSVPLDDLLRVAVSGARLAERCVAGRGVVHEYRPREWKGSTPKPPHHARMWNALDDRERELLGGAKTHAAIHGACMRGGTDAWKKPGATYYRAKEFPTVGGVKITHDILDAVALALYDLKRISKG